MHTAVGVALGAAEDRDKPQAPGYPWSPLSGLALSWPPLSKHLLNYLA